MQTLAVIANDPEHMPSLLFAVGKELQLHEGDDEVWGVGYYANDRALTIHKPGDLLASRGFHAIAPDVKSRVLLAFVRRGAETRRAPPHRFRSWLFGAVGDLSPLDPVAAKVAERLPSFIRSELSDAGASELVFGMFLREQHEMGILGDGLVTGARIGEAMSRTAAAIDMLATEAGVEAPKAAYAATNGRVVAVSRRGTPIHWKLQRGLEALPDGPPDRAMNEFKQVVEALRRFRAVVFATGVDAAARHWTELADGATVWVDRQLEVAPA